MSDSNSNSKIITLDDGFKITRIVCECGQTMTITTESMVYFHCGCGRKHLNIAYYYINEKGMLDYVKR